jgi:hypothetical protein
LPAPGKWIASAVATAGWARGPDRACSADDGIGRGSYERPMPCAPAIAVAPHQVAPDLRAFSLYPALAAARSGWHEAMGGVWDQRRCAVRGAHAPRGGRPFRPRPVWPGQRDPIVERVLRLEPP